MVRVTDCSPVGLTFEFSGRQKAQLFDGPLERFVGRRDESFDAYQFSKYPLAGFRL